ncbi:hypothetical protein ACSBR2_016902 [Camellia fascicularis]
MTGKYATPATNELGIQIRSLASRGWILLRLQNLPSSKLFLTSLKLETISTMTYKHNRLYTLKQEFELLEGLPIDEIYAYPPLGVSLDDWKHLIDVAWQDASHQKRSRAGKSNRSQLPYNHINGSRSFLIVMAAMKEMVNVQAAAIESGTPMTQEELSRQVLGQNKRYLLGFGSGPQPSTISASRAHDKDMEAMRAEVEALREERQKDHDELMNEREERERYYNEILKEREERIQLANEMLKE